MKIDKKPLLADRVRKIEGPFSFIPRRFLSDGFLASLNQNELLIYFLLILVGDRNGLSYYSQDKQCILLRMDFEDFLEARNGLLKKSLIAFDGFMFQVLSLPKAPVSIAHSPLMSREDFRQKDSLTIRQAINNALRDSAADEENEGGRP